MSCKAYSMNVNSKKTQVLCPIHHFEYLIIHSRKHPIGKILFESEWFEWKNYEMGNDHIWNRLRSSGTHSIASRIHLLQRTWWIRWDEEFIPAYEDEVMVLFLCATQFANGSPCALCVFLSNRTPFDENTVHGFCVILFLNYVSGIVILLALVVVVPTLILTMGLFFNTFRKHFELMFANMNDLVGEHRPADYVLQLKSSLIEAINFHNRARG